MSRNLKAIGLALLAIFATGALTASAASAVEDHFTSTTEKALVTGVTHNAFFQVTGGRISHAQQRASLAQPQTTARKRQ